MGAIVGANLRYFLTQYVGAIIPSSFPYGTLVINLTASFILGFFLILASKGTLSDPRWRLLIAVGFCGGYSTYSGFAFETAALYERGAWLAAAMNVVAMNVLCFIAVIGGAALGRVF